MGRCRFALALMLSTTGVTFTAYTAAMYRMQRRPGFSIPPFAADADLEPDLSTPEEVAAQARRMASDARVKWQRLRISGMRLNDFSTRLAVLRDVRLSLITSSAEEAGNRTGPTSGREGRNALLDAVVSTAAYHLMFDVVAAAIDTIPAAEEQRSALTRECLAPLKSFAETLLHTVRDDSAAEVADALSRLELVPVFDTDPALELGVTPVIHTSDKRGVPQRLEGSAVKAVVLHDVDRRRLTVMPMRIERLSSSPWSAWRCVAPDPTIHGRAMSEGQVFRWTDDAVAELYPALRSAVPQLAEPLLEGRKPYDVLLLGHGRIGAVTQLLASALSRSAAVRHVTVVSFGAPRAFDVIAAEAMNRNAKLTNVRVVVDTDYAPWLPSRALGFRHCGVPVPVLLPMDVSASYLRFAWAALRSAGFHSLSLYSECLGSLRFAQATHPSLPADGGRCWS